MLLIGEGTADIQRMIIGRRLLEDLRAADRPERRSQACGAPAQPRANRSRACHSVGD